MQFLSDFGEDYDITRKLNELLDEENEAVRKENAKI